MGYGNQSRQGLVTFATTWLATIATQTAADKALAQVHAPITVLRIGVHIVVAMTVTAAVVDFDRRITVASDTGRISFGTAGHIGRLTLPVTGSAIGQLVYKDVSVDLNPGDEVVYELVTASTAGSGIPFMQFVARDEVPGNYSEMIASA